jgi:hypothetical protein
MDYRKVDANTIEFDLPVKKNASSEVTYTVHYRW